MQIYKHESDCKDMISPVGNTWRFYPYNEYDIEDMCFFDIETTGLSAAAASIYLIGAGYYDVPDEKFRVIQWFADDYDSEKDMLREFLSFAGSYKVLFQYNGNTFDIPFVRERCKRHRLDCSVLGNIRHIDLYASLRGYSKALGLSNKKLVSFEKYVGLNREDRFDGGALISVYVEYVHNRIMQKENEPLLKTLLLHNLEDIIGLSNVAVLLFLKELGRTPVSFAGAALTEDGVMEVNYKGSFPYECLLEPGKGIVLNCTGSEAVLRIPVRSDTLNYYFTDYKDYYYMTEEGTVMHKSVAVYADSSVRRKARKNECYVKKEGSFIPVNKPGCFSECMHIFREDYTAKEYYVEVNESIMSDADFFEKYFGQVIGK